MKKPSEHTSPTHDDIVEYPTCDDALTYIDAIIEFRKNNPEIYDHVTRKAFICIGCDGVYSDEPVSRCDCMIHFDYPEGTNLFYEGTINYKKLKNK